MGLEHGTVDQIKAYPQIFGKCYLEELPLTTRITTIVDDFHISVRTVDYMAPSYQDIVDRMASRILKSATPSTRRYIVSIDESEYVPKSKQPTQKSRSQNQFSELQKEHIIIGTEPIIPPALGLTPQEFFGKLNSTRGMVSDIQHYTCARLLSLDVTEHAATQNLTVIFDGVNLKRIKGYASEEVLQAIPVDISRNPCSKTILVERTWRPKQVDDSRNVIISVAPRDGPPKISVCESSKIGEVDVKMVRDIFTNGMHEGGDVLIKTTDSDSIPIVLLALRDLINDKVRKFPFRVYVEFPDKKEELENLATEPEKHDDNPPSARESPVASERKKKYLYFDAVEAWRSIHHFFSQKFPFFTCPIETTVSIMLLCGSDYTDKLVGITPKDIWSFCFLDEAFKYMGCSFDPYGSSLDNFVDDEETDAVIVSSDTGFFSRHGITITHNKFYEFIKNLFFYKKKNQIPRPVAIPLSVLREEMNIPAIEKYKQAMEEAELKRKRGLPTRNPNRPFLVPEDDEIHALIRRIWWTLDYWMNGAKPVPEPVMNPIAVNARNISVCGWQEENGIVVKARKIERRAK
jgi:hypothetical protein